AMSEYNPTLRELVEFRDRYGLEAYVIWCCGIVEMPRAHAFNMLRIGRHLRDADPGALSILMKARSTAAIDEAIHRSAAGELLTPEAAAEIVARHTDQW